MYEPAIVRVLDHLREPLEERYELFERHRPVPVSPSDVFYHWRAWETLTKTCRPSGSRFFIGSENVRLSP